MGMLHIAAEILALVDRLAVLLRRAVGAECRETFVPIYNGTATAVKLLEEQWRDVKPLEARAILARPDVTVTNQSDKDMQLPKLKQLDELVRETFAQMSREANAKRAEAARLEEEAQALVEKAKGLREEADEMEASMRCSA